ncbi:hypothetical protein HMPREF3219_0201423 [Streptococcus salivarius]|nr:hypothetical protein HMPREF3219_0201423 [Streptococcus salivarius]
MNGGFSIALATKIGLSMKFFFYLMIEVRKMEVLPFALLLIEANATIKL